MSYSKKKETKKFKIKNLEMKEKPNKKIIKMKKKENKRTKENENNLEANIERTGITVKSN